MANLLKIENLRVKANGKEILKGVNLSIKPGETQALLGPNASGKTALSQVILGNPKYKVTAGKILFKNKNITNFPSEKRAKLGLALAWQYPPSIKGIKLSQLLSKISSGRGGASINLAGDGFQVENLLEREINVDFSGGEKKTSELLQILALNPQLVIFDEIDSGLDIERMEKVVKTIKEKFVKKKVALLLITHWGHVLKFLKPDVTNVMVDGKIICCSKDYKRVLDTIKKYGYEKCKKCPFLAGR